MSTYKDVHFLWWDWKGQIDTDKLDKALKQINGPARASYVNTGSDMYGLAIHPPDWNFTEDEWYTISNLFRILEEDIAETATPKDAKELLEKARLKLKEEEEEWEEKANKEREEKERQQFEELKKKYEGKQWK